MEKLSKIVAVILFIFAISFFINGYYGEKDEFQSQVNYIIKQKINGSKGSVSLIVYEKNPLDSFKYVLATEKLFDLIEANDSIVKYKNSFTVFLYRKINGNYKIIDSMENGPVGLYWILHH